MSGKNYKAHNLESSIKTDFMKYARMFYPTAHTVLIPASAWSLLPYDCYIHYDKIFRAVELKIDDHDVEAHQYHALFEVVQNGGYAFVVRWMNLDRKFIVENFTLGTAEIFRGQPSERQLGGHSTLDADEKPAQKKGAFKQTLDYICSFSVTPMDAELQKIIAKNHERMLREVGKIK